MRQKLLDAIKVLEGGSAVPMEVVRELRQCVDDRWPAFERYPPPEEADFLLNPLRSAQ